MKNLILSDSKIVNAANSFFALVRIMACYTCIDYIRIIINVILLKHFKELMIIVIEYEPRCACPTRPDMCEIHYSQFDVHQNHVF